MYPNKSFLFAYIHKIYICTKSVSWFSIIRVYKQIKTLCRYLHKYDFYDNILVVIHFYMAKKAIFSLKKND